MKKAGKLSSLGILLRLLLLVIAIAAQFSIKARYWNYYYPETVIIDYNDLVLQAVPAQLKSVSAGLMRLTADEYMHIGPYKKVRQNFIAGSFAGNTEIMSLLKLALYLEPSHIETYTIMSQNLAMYLDRFEDGIRLVQQGILANKDSVDLHKLYSAGAYCYGFAESYTFNGPMPINNDRAVALNYLEAAIKCYLANVDRMSKDSYDVFANLDNYYLLKSRFLLDVGKKSEALATWQLVPKNLRSGLLATYFALMEQGVAVPDSPGKLFEQILAGQSGSKEKPHPYILPDGWYQSLFNDPKDDLKSISYLLNRASASRIDAYNPFSPTGFASARSTQENQPEQHEQQPDSEEPSCDHADHSAQECSHQHHQASEWAIFSEARGAILQAVLMVASGLLIRRFFTR
ncbi:MAG: hypothetical protein KKB51_19660 [Candidatus Riflebacteria bacterium]|nr:hypothetical protein [Candidatus Riflebacteria bacterium]